MKKLIALALISMLCISLCSCIYNEVTFDDTDNAQATDDATETGGTQNNNTDPSDTNPSETDPSETEGSTDTEGNTTETQKPSNNDEWTNNY